jgi:hypothetical protein
LPPLHFKTVTPSSKFVFCETGFGGASLDFTISLQIQSGNNTKCSIKGGKMEMWIVLFWSGPIGLGIGLALIGTFVWLLAKADEISKRTKAFVKEKGLEKK